MGTTGDERFGARRAMSRSRRRGVAVAAGVVALLAGVVAVPTARAAGGAASPIRYAVATPVCAQAQPGHAMCFAVRLQRVSSTTPGARAYRAAGGAFATGPAGGLTPGDLASAYSFDSTTGGTGQTVAIIDWGDDPTIEHDLGVFDTNYGLAACTTANGCFKKVNQLGQVSPLPGNQGTSTEIALDVESVHAVCQHCKILLIEVNNNQFVSTDAGVNRAATMGATEISNSYGSHGEFNPSAADLAAYKHSGVVITVSTGDDGYFGYDRWVYTPPGGPRKNAGSPSFPANLATIVSVGGTTLHLNPNGTRASETVWNNNGVKSANETSGAQGAGGGGCSGFVNAPAWQLHVATWPLTACGPHRLAADVSAVADPLTGLDIYDTTAGTGWYTVGGTSLSAPVIAAIYALAGGAHGVGYPALTAYGHRASAAFYDVTIGGNGYCDGEDAATCGDANDLGAWGGTVPLGVMDCGYPAGPQGTPPNPGNYACAAHTGYDGPTGVGTPNGIVAFAPTGPKAVITGPTTVTHGVTVTFKATSSTDPFPGGKLTFIWNWGDGTPNSAGATVTHKYAHAASSRTITLTATDNYGQKGTKTQVERVR